jgi:hypothetical protein
VCSSSTIAGFPGIQLLHLLLQLLNLLQRGGIVLRNLPQLVQLICPLLNRALRIRRVRPHLRSRSRPRRAIRLPTRIHIVDRRALPTSAVLLHPASNNLPTLPPIASTAAALLRIRTSSTALPRLIPLPTPRKLPLPLTLTLSLPLLTLLSLPLLTPALSLLPLLPLQSTP